MESAVRANDWTDETSFLVLSFKVLKVLLSLTLLLSRKFEDRWVCIVELDTIPTVNYSSGLPFRSMVC